MNFETAFAGHAVPAPLPLAALSPAEKLAAAAIFSVGISLLTHPLPALAACLAPLALSRAGRLPWPALLTRLLPVNFFFLFLWATLLPDFSSGGLALSSPGLRLAALITIKGNAVAAALLVLVGTTGLNASCRALLQFRLPEKLVTLLLLTSSQIAAMADTYASLSKAAKLRGFTPGVSPASWRTTAYLLGMLLLRSWQRSRRIATAMRLRGFSGRFPLLASPPAAGSVLAGHCLLAAICVITGLLTLADRTFFAG
ncbi:MAG: energy-coupling factor transporter transmembrane protein EcfT [Desulfovibrio sp.]|jgi:cobalt/nickel transport system permease protein|nr:energy-coupling factor transporter transmembrane protein EcfT [Desulfovibrio sp.]